MIERKPQRRQWVAVLAAGALLLTGCTGQDADDGERAQSPTSQPPSSPPASSWSAPTATGEFVYKPPQEPCPPVSAMRLPSAEDYPYAVTVPSLDEGPGIIEQVCHYQLAGMTEEEQNMVLADHIWMAATFTLFPSSEDSFYGDFDNLPLVSGDLGDWEQAATVHSGNSREVWEGCGPAIPCADGEEPTVRTRAVSAEIDGRVENLHLTARIIYTAEDLPADVERRSLEIYRDLVLAVVATRERVE